MIYPVRSRTSAYRRRGLTLVELLVVIAIIGILVGLLLPAVQAARESARQVHCRNNLKQLALACQNYEGIWGVIPGYAGEVNPALVVFDNRRADPSMRGGNWLSKVAPYLEEQSIGDAWVNLGSSQQPILDPIDLDHLDATQEELHCTTRRSAKVYPLHGTFATRFGEEAARSDYAMNGGSAIVDDTLSLNRTWIRVIDDGAWQLGRLTGFKAFRDGTSNTYLLGEKAMNSDKYLTGNDFGDRSPASGWVDNHTASGSYVRYASRSPIRDVPDNCNACHEFGSAHAANWNAAFADGSVRSVAYTLSLRVHRANASIQGGE